MSSPTFLDFGNLLHILLERALNARRAGQECALHPNSPGYLGARWFPAVLPMHVGNLLQILLERALIARSARQMSHPFPDFGNVLQILSSEHCSGTMFGLFAACSQYMLTTRSANTLQARRPCEANGIRHRAAGRLAC